MLSALFKPKWQHKDANVRLKSLASLSGDSEELIQLAMHDPNGPVRLEAIERLSHLDTLISLAKQENSYGASARGRLGRLILVANHQDAQLVDMFERLDIPPDSLIVLAEDNERSTALRRLALAKVQDQAVLFRIANNDKARDLQFEAASRLQDTGLLQQLEKTHGRNNKRLRQLLKERLAQEEAAQQVQQGLQKLCADMDDLGRGEQWAQDRTRYRILLENWKKQQASHAITEAVQAQFVAAEQGFLQRLQVHEAEQAQQAPRLAVFEAYLTDLEHLTQQLAQPDEHLVLADCDAKLKQMQAGWQQAEALPAAQQEKLDSRFAQLLEQVHEARAAVAGELSALSALQDCLQGAEHMRQSEKPLQIKRVTDLQADWIKAKRPQGMQAAVQALETRFQQTLSSLNARLQKQAAQRDEILQAVQADMVQLEADLELEKYGDAVDLQQKISHILQDHTDLPAREINAIKARLHAVTPLLMEFKDWRRWGTDQAREHLIETAQGLENDESLDPQVRAREIKALREEWRKLAQMEPGQQRKQWKVFDSKVNAAYAVSKQHFEEQASEREAHLRVREGLCAELETLVSDTDWPAADWHAVYVKMNKLRKAWKECGTVGHKAWKSINERFNAAMDALEVHLAPERERNFAMRQSLVQTAKGLLEQDDIQEAIERAKQLRGRWQISVPSRSKDEQKLWKQFQTSLDAVFERLRDSRQSERKAMEARIAEKNALCETIEAMADLQGQAFKAAYAELEMHQAAFNAIDDIPKTVQQKVTQRFQKAEQALMQRAAQLRWQDKLSALDALALESEARKQGESDAAAAKANQAQGELLCLRLELLLELPSPSEFRQARMSYQVANLSEAMVSRKAAIDQDQEAIRLLKGWYKIGSMSDEALASQQARLDAVRLTLAGKSL